MTPTEKILARLGLQEVMEEYDRDAFHTYVPRDYPGSDRERMDEVYRMSEIVLVHKATRLHLEYLTTESYYGDAVRYRFRSMFIITQAGDKVAILDVNFEKQYFSTSAGRISFDRVISMIA